MRGGKLPEALFIGEELMRSRGVWGGTSLAHNLEPLSPQSRVL